MTYKSLFDVVKNQLEQERKKDKILDEAMAALDYFSLSNIIRNCKRDLNVDDMDAIFYMVLDVDRGESEGIYVDFKIQDFPDEGLYAIAIAKTLYKDAYHFRLMGYFAAAFAEICKDIIIKWQNEVSQ